MSDLSRGRGGVAVENDAWGRWNGWPRRNTGDAETRSWGEESNTTWLRQACLACKDAFHAGTKQRCQVLIRYPDQPKVLISAHLVLREQRPASCRIFGDVGRPQRNDGRRCEFYLNPWSFRLKPANCVPEAARKHLQTERWKRSEFRRVPVWTRNNAV